MIKYLVLAAGVATLAVPSFAQQGGGGGRMQRTPEELAAAFDKADANKDGSLDKAELKTTLPEQFQAQVDDARLTQMLERRDTDKNGKVSKAEFTTPPPPRPQ
jgi:Ca2+-binding EF-hand superfamily protein